MLLYTTLPQVVRPSFLPSITNFMIDTIMTSLLLFVVESSFPHLVLAFGVLVSVTRQLLLAIQVPV
jgi:hypothetical protein